jgi:hypothetical protein
MDFQLLHIVEKTLADTQASEPLRKVAAELQERLRQDTSHNAAVDVVNLIDMVKLTPELNIAVKAAAGSRYILYFDIETTGTKNARLFQIAAKVVDTDGNEVMGSKLYNIQVPMDDIPEQMVLEKLSPGLVGEEADGWFFDLINLTEPFHGFYWGLLIFAILVVIFAFFYSNMQVNPEKIADNFSKSGAYIPGIRPGKETERYISKVLNRVTLMGAGFITLIAVLPYILQIVMGYFSEYAANLASGFGGTSIIIVVGVALETVKEIEGRMAGKDYSGLSMKNTY